MILDGSGGCIFRLRSKSKLPPTEQEHYEGLVHKTAYDLVKAGVELEQEDVEQIIRIKVHKALAAYNPDKARGLPIERYVFMCVMDQAKDLKARRRHGTVSLEGTMEFWAMRGTTRTGYADTKATQDNAEAKYLSREDDGFRRAEDEGVVLPSTLSDLECTIVLYLYRHYRQGEIATELGIATREMARLMAGIKMKLADWRPTQVPAPPPSSVVRDESQRRTGPHAAPAAEPGQAPRSYRRAA